MDVVTRDNIHLANFFIVYVINNFPNYIALFYRRFYYFRKVIHSFDNFRKLGFWRKKCRNIFIYRKGNSFIIFCLVYLWVSNNVPRLYYCAIFVVFEKTMIEYQFLVYNSFQFGENWKELESFFSISYYKFCRNTYVPENVKSGT